MASGQAIDWAEGELDWDNISEQAISNFTSGTDEDEALQEAIQQDITRWANENQKEDRSNIGIWTKSDKMWGSFSGYVSGDVSFIKRNVNDIQRRKDSAYNVYAVSPTNIIVYDSEEDTEGTEIQYDENIIRYAQTKGII